MHNAILLFILLLPTALIACSSSQNASNDVPVVEAGENQTIILPAPASLDGTVDDDDLEHGRMTITWSKWKGPGGVTFGADNAVDTTASFSAAGIYVLRLTASDGEHSAHDDVTITVNPDAENQAPVAEAEAEPQTVGVGEVVVLDGKDSSDPGGDSLSYHWSISAEPEGSNVVLNNPSMVSASFVPSVKGLYTLTLTVSDGEKQHSDAVKVTVTTELPVGVHAVAATAETAPVPGGGDADDPAIWVHPTEASLSTIIGTAKDAGLAVYDLAGRQLQHLPDGDINNVDLRYNFPLDGQSVALVTASNQTYESVSIYRVNPTTRLLEDVAARKVRTADYGLCMYHSPVSGKFYFFVTDTSGNIEQWELLDNGSGKVDTKLVRTLKVESKVEGCVADDELAQLYLSQETGGIWKFGAEPTAGSKRTLVDTVNSNTHLTADVEGLTIYYGEDGEGYLIASSQGNDNYIVYRREGNNDYVMTFKVAGSNGVDGVSHTDGVDVTSAPLGKAFPQGALVIQDGDNGDSKNNFKLVPWQVIVSEIGSR